jgi:hypothetical protein
MSDEQSFALEDAVAAIAKSECPGDWARYCQLAHVPGSDSDPEAEARNLLTKRALSRDDSTYDWVEGAPHLEEAINLEHKFRDQFLAAIRDGRCGVRGFARDDLRSVVVPPQLLTHESLKLDHKGMMHLGESKLFGVHVVFTAPQEAPGAHAMAASQEVPAVFGPSREAPGPKPGHKTEKDRACSEALNILNNDAERPAKRHGRNIMIARRVKERLGIDHQPDSIAKMIRPTIADWEKRNPDK